MNTTKKKIRSRRSLKRQKYNNRSKISQFWWLAVLQLSIIKASFPPSGPCWLNGDMRQFSFEGEDDDDNRVNRPVQCPSASSQFRFSTWFFLNSDISGGDKSILFAYHNLIKIWVEKSGSTYEIVFWRSGEPSGGKMFQTKIRPDGKDLWAFIMLEVSSSGAIMVARRSRSYSMEENNYKSVIFSKSRDQINKNLKN